MARVPKSSAIKFILSEDLRSEGNGKFSLLGVFPGERFTVTGEPPPGFPDLAFAMPSLTFVFVVTDGEGKMSSRLRIVAPNKKLIVDAPIGDQTIEIIKDRPAIFASSLKPFAGSHFGKYTALLEIGKSTFRFPFLIEKAPAAKKR